MINPKHARGCKTSMRGSLLYIRFQLEVSPPSPTVIAQNMRIAAGAKSDLFFMILLHDKLEQKKI